MAPTFIRRIPIESSSIASVGHEPRTSILEVEFCNGSVYRYFAVPRAIFDQLIGAESKGRYLNRFVRNHYPAERVTLHDR